MPYASKRRQKLTELSACIERNVSVRRAFFRDIIFPRRNIAVRPSVLKSGVQELIRFRNTACFVIALTALMSAYGTAFAADPNDDPNIDPILPDPVTDSHQFPPAMATAGTGDPGPELYSSPVSPQMLAGRGAGCSPMSPCAVNSPPIETFTPVSSSKSAGHQAAKTGTTRKINGRN